MKEYVLIFRMDITTPAAQPTPEQMSVYMRDWMKWMNAISDKGQLADGGNHLSYTAAKVLRPGKVKTEGPYTVNKESVAGYIIILAKDMEGAVKIAEKCPILEGQGTSVEIRETAAAGL